MNSELDDFEQEASAVHTSKCEHGCYIPESDCIARYCTACYPDHCGIIASPKRVLAPLKQERTLDVAESLERPLSERLAFANQMEDICQ